MRGETGKIKMFLTSFMADYFMAGCNNLSAGYQGNQVVTGHCHGPRNSPTHTVGRSVWIRASQAVFPGFMLS